MKLCLFKSGRGASLMMVVACFVISNALATTYPSLAMDAPSGAIMFPDVFTAFAPPTNSLAPATGTPEIAEWTRVNDPGDTMILTGEALSRHTGVAEGRDTRFLFFGQSAEARIELEGAIQRLDGREVAVTLPQGLPPSEMYLLWPENENGVGHPVAINQAESWWVGPEKVAPGKAFSIHGRNLSLGGGASHVYIEELGRWLESSSANPYKATFTLPADVAEGEYTVWAHNGHGRSFGWSSSLVLTVEKDIDWSKGATINVKDHGAKGDGSTDDRSAIQSAINSADWGDTVFLPEGVYLVGDRVKSISGKRLLGAGMDKTKISSHPNFSSGGVTALLHVDRNYRFEMRDLSFHAGDHLGGKKMFHAREVSDAQVVNVRFSQLDTPNRQDVVDAAKSVRMKFMGCEFLTARNVFVGWSRQIAFEGCHWFGLYDCNVLLSVYGADELSVSGCTAQHYEGTNQTSGRGWCSGRFLWGSGHGGSHRNIYIGENELNNLHPRFDPRFEKWEQELNTGEHVMFELTATYYDGFASSGTRNTVALRDSSPNLGGKIIVITDGKGRGQSREIVSHDTSSNVVSVDRPWNVTPDGSSKLAAGHYVNQMAVHGNLFDGHERLMDTQPNSNRYATNVTATTAVSMYGAFQDLVIAENRIQQARSGIFCWGFGYDHIQEDVVNNPQPNYFNLIQDNTIKQCHTGIYVKTATFNNHARSPGKVIAYNVWRGNQLSQISHTAVLYETGIDEFTVGMTVFDGNTASDLGLKSISDATSLENQIWVGNVFDGGGEDSAISFSDGHVPALSDNQWNNYQKPYGAEAPGAVLELPSRRVTLNAHIASREIVVANGGNAPLVWTASVDKSWVSLSLTNGVVEDESDRDRITISVDPASVPENASAAIITFTGAGRTKQMIVEFNEDASPPRTLSHIQVSGPGFIDERASAQFYCLAMYDDGSSVGVVPAWQVTAGATINDSGLLTASDVAADQVIQVRAEFHGEVSTRSATIRHIPPTLDAIKITGPLNVNENATAAYSCVASYSDGSSVQVKPTWSENGSATQISAEGLLSIGDIDADTSFSLTAAFGGLTQSISVSISDAPLALTGLTIVGPLSLAEGATAQYGCVGTFEDGGTRVVYPDWSENSSTATITVSGLLSAGDVTSDQMILISAELNGISASQAVNILYVAPYVTELLISGASQVSEKTSSTYVCSAVYSDGSQVVVSPTWSASGAASIDASGTLTAADVAADQSATVSAQYGGVSATMNVMIHYVAPAISGISIEGPRYVDEGLIVSYDCVATYVDGTTDSVTPTWSVISPYASVDAGGALSALNVASDQTVSLVAMFEGHQATQLVTIKYVAPPASLMALSITAPTGVKENTTTALSCVATYSDGSTGSISPEWSTDDPRSTVDADGVLNAGNVDEDAVLKVTATYAGSSTTVNIDLWAEGTQSIYPLNGFDGKTVKARLWDEAAQEWHELGEMDSPRELVVENVNTGQWYWVTIEEYNSGVDDWDLVHANWIGM